MNNQTVRLREEIELSRVALNPVFPTGYFTHDISIPNGAFVTCPKQPQLNFEWQDGNLVPIADEDLLAKIEATGLMEYQGNMNTSVSLTRYVLLLANVLVVAVVLTVLIRRRIQR